MGKVDYHAYINSEAWKAKREAYIQERHPTRCWVCSRPWKRSDPVHHLSYRRLGYETFDDLTHLCPYCHKAVHSFFDSQRLQFPTLTLRNATYRYRKAYLSGQITFGRWVADPTITGKPSGRRYRRGTTTSRVP